MEDPDRGIRGQVGEQDAGPGGDFAGGAADRAQRALLTIGDRVEIPEIPLLQRGPGIIECNRREAVTRRVRASANSTEAPSITTRSVAPQPSWVNTDAAATRLARATSQPTARAVIAPVLAARSDP
jgi:hypothetical protein